VYVAIFIQRAKRMCHIIVYDLCGSKIFFHITSPKHQDFGKTLLHINCVLIFSVHLSEILLILSRNERDIIKNVHTSSCKVTARF